MNKNIRQILDKANNMANEVFDYDGTEYTDIVQEKLIELIVKECAEIAKHNVMNISTYADAEFVDKSIKEHFGVKE